MKEVYSLKLFGKDEKMELDHYKQFFTVQF